MMDGNSFPRCRALGTGRGVEHSVFKEAYRNHRKPKERWGNHGCNMKQRFMAHNSIYTRGEYWIMVDVAKLCDGYTTGILPYLSFIIP